jgi:hypothetical protein
MIGNGKAVNARHLLRGGDVSERYAKIVAAIVLLATNW